MWKVNSTWNPEHGGKRNGKSKQLSPGRILIVTHGDGGVSHKVEHKDELSENNDKTYDYTLEQCHSPP